MRRCGGGMARSRWAASGWGWRGQRVDAGRLADALERQSEEFGAGAAALENIEKLRNGCAGGGDGAAGGAVWRAAADVVEGGYGGGAGEAGDGGYGCGACAGVLAGDEDHDLEEVDQVSLLTKDAVETLRAGLKVARAVPVGGVELGAEMDAVLERASELLAYAPECDLLRECYAPTETYKPTLGGAFARLMARMFAAQGLIVMDAAGREFHALGERTLRYAIEHAEELEAALLARTRELESGGYHAQVLVAAGHSCCF